MTRPMMFLSFNRGNKENGYYHVAIRARRSSKLVEGPISMRLRVLPVKATG
ncbi:MAG: hypothetical protein ACLR1G_08110 [Alistipes indistinctus]